MSGMLAVVRIRGTTHQFIEAKKTCDTLNLRTRNSCVVVPNTPATKGMLLHAYTMLTWGPANDVTIKSVEKKQGNKKCAFMNPPRKGYGRKGVKTSFSQGGAFGDRGDKINDLVARMM